MSDETKNEQTTTDTGEVWSVVLPADLAGRVRAYWKRELPGVSSRAAVLRQLLLAGLVVEECKHDNDQSQ